MYKPTTTAWKPPVSFLFKLSLIATAVAGVGLTTGCSSTPSNSKVQKSQVGMLDANSLDSLEDLLSATDMRAVEGDRLLILKHGDVWKRMTVGFKMDGNKWDPRIDAQRSWFITRQPYLDRLSARASRYLYHTVKEAERRGLPTELALLPVIESSYDPAATSSAAAAGMWQFIPSTGKIYGLRQTSMYDGRRDVVESTRAAYEFLGSLYNQFGSWELALAAYNAGPGRVQQAINRNRAAGLPTDYWSLRLPQETMNYVPRFLAVAQIIKSPHQYGVNLPPIANRPHFREVSVPAGASLNEIAAITGLGRAELYQLNPGHRGDIVDVSSTQKILIPADLNPNIDTRLKALKPNSSGYLVGVNTPSSTSITTTSSTKPIVTSTNPPPVLNTTQTASNTKPLTATTPVTTSVTTQPVVTTPTATAPVSSTSVTTLAKTPTGSDALAAFASSAVVPSAPRIPVAVTPAQNVKPVVIEPPISDAEKQKILASLPVDSKETVQQELAQVLEPKATQAETDEVVKEITALAPKGTEVVDPLDGKIKLTAIQTSQSVASTQGEEVKVGFAYPKAVAENTAPTSEEAQLNQDKTFVKTESEVVVEPPKGKRSTYTVVGGDTLAVIALKNSVNWRDIAKWNQIDPNGTLFVGSTLYLYDAKPQVQDPRVVIPKPELKPTSYVVKPNDSLSEIARDLDIPLPQLAEWNDLTVNSNVFVGQKLTLVEPKVKKAPTSEVVKSANNAIKTKVYIVKRGEYLKLIADRYALSNQEFAALTPGLKADSYLIVGQKINVPVDQLPDASEKKASSTVSQVKIQPEYKTESYKVQSGETLYSIAMKSKMTLTELAELNNLQVNKGLFAGQTIKIPAGSTVPDTYTVQSGDSLHAVASKYNLGIAQIADLNGLSPSAGLFVGQKLKLSGSPETAKVQTSTNTKTQSTAASKKTEVETESYAVRSGETLASIARKFDMSLNELVALNDMSLTSTIRVGQKLKVQGGEPEPAKATNTPSTKKSNQNTESYTVKSGESLNDMSLTSTIRVGQKLKVQGGEPEPAKATNTPSTKKSNQNTESYTVKSGESLNAIAAKVGISAKELADLNNLTVRSGLQRGQSIQVPKTVTEYKIKSGDSLIRLASKYGIETNQLAEMNDLKPNASLRVGDIIKVPNL